MMSVINLVTLIVVRLMVFHAAGHLILLIPFATWVLCFLFSSWGFAARMFVENLALFLVAFLACRFIRR
jgi:hypothetical protein